MEELDIPIFRKTYDLYKALHGLRNAVPKADRHGLWQRIEQTTLDVITHLLVAGERAKERKSEALENASVRLNLLRILLRLAKDTKIIDLKKYAVMQQTIDDIGRQLGGWIKSLRSPKEAAPPPRGIFEEREKEVPERPRPDVVVGIAVPVVDVELIAIPLGVDPVAVGGPNGASRHPLSLRIERKRSLRCI